MASLNVLDLKGKEIEKIDISEDIIGQKPNSEVLYQEVRRYLAAVRAGTHNTKGRSDVRGGGRKPWRQKGTGNARAGTIRSPIWRGGGVIFGPKTRDHSFKLNKKMIKKSKKIALSDKFQQKRIIVLDKLDFKKPDTKKAAEILSKLKVDGKKVLVIVDNIYGSDAKSFRNIKNAAIESASGINTYIIILADYIIFTKDSINKVAGGLTDG